MSCFVSIVIPTYNRKRLVRESIEAALGFMAKSDVPMEIIVIDDASTDGTPEAIREVYGHWLELGRLHFLVNRNNLGVTGARNLAAKTAQGKWLMFVDSDDCLIPESAPKICRVLKRKSRYPMIIFRCQQYETGMMIGIGKCQEQEISLRDFLNDFQLGECLPVIQKHVFARYPYQARLKGCEGLTYARMMRRLGPILASPLVARRYRMDNEDRLSSRRGLYQRSCMIKSYHWQLLRHFRSDLTPSNQSKTLGKWIIYAMMCQASQIHTKIKKVT